MRKNVADKTKQRFVPSAEPSSRGGPGFFNTVVLTPASIARQVNIARSKAIKPLLNLAAAAVIAQSAAMPAWGAHLLSCGLTHALRTIQSVETSKAAAEKSRVHQRAFPPQDLI